MKRFVFILSSVAAGIFIILLLLWHIAVPEEVIRGVFTEITHIKRAEVKAEGLRKGFFYNVCSEKVFLYKGTSEGSEPLITIDDACASLNLSSLLQFSPSVDLTARINEGIIKGSFQITGQRGFTLFASDINIADIGALRAYNIEGRGLMNLEASYNGSTGFFTLRMDKSELKSFFAEGVMIPLNMFESLRGTGEFKKDLLTLKSLAFNGEGIQAVLRGNYVAGAVDMTMEVMTNSSFTKSALLDAALARHKRSPGYYLVPVRFKAG